MKFHLITYADEKFESIQEQLHEHVSSLKEFSSITGYTRKWLKTTDFYDCHRLLLDEKRGSGWWAWKPYILKQKMKQIDNGDVVVYVDCGDTLQNGITNYLKTILEFEPCLLLCGGNPNSAWTKRESFIFMNCDNEEFWSLPQLEAGFQAWKKCYVTEHALQLYLEWTCNRIVVTDEKFSAYENFADFQDHRHDQSILTNIAHQLSLPIDGVHSQYRLARNFVTCNVRNT